MAYQIQSNQLLPYGGEREGAEVHWQSNLFLPLGKVRMGYPTGKNERGLKFIGKVTCSFPWGRLGWVILRGEQEGAEFIG